MQNFSTSVVFAVTRFTAFQLLGIFLVVVSLTMPPLVVHAQVTESKPSFFLQPATYNSSVPATKSLFMLNAQPGATLQESVIVTNIGSAAGSVSIYPVSDTTSQNSGVAYLSKNATPRDVGAWIKLPAQQLKLSPGQSRIVSFQIAVPNSARAGYHLGGIAAEDLLPTNSFTTGQIRIDTMMRHIVPVEVNLPGPLVEQMAVTGAKAGGSNGYQTIILSIANTGNVILKPTGELKVSNAQGQLLQDLPLKMNTFLPNTAINYPVNVQKKALTAGDYQVSLHLNYGHGKTLDYTTKLTITQDQVAQAFSNGPLQAPTSSAMMPLWQMILVALAALIILLMGGKKVYDLIAAHRRKQTKNPTPPVDGSHSSMSTSKRRDKVA